MHQYDTSIRARMNDIVSANIKVATAAVEYLVAANRCGHAEKNDASAVCIIAVCQPAT